MLNISESSLNDDIKLNTYESGSKVYKKSFYKTFNKLSLLFLIIGLSFLFLPWTQNINGFGYVTTLRPEQRPQTIQSPIPGRIDAWYVQEGNFIKKGDTILKISEIKSDYFDDELMSRTSEQIKSKTSSVSAYQNKSKAISNQIAALKKEQQLYVAQAKNKLIQAQIKVKSDSIDAIAAKTDETIALKQLERIKNLKNEGLKSVRDVEEKQRKFQSARAKYTSQNNTFLESKNKILNAEIELSRIKNSFADKIAKSESELYSAQSSEYNTLAEVAKLKNAYSNYGKRQSLLYITAPQDGYINKTIKSGIGETFKPGEALLKIMPADYDLGVETFIKPIDLPLIHLGEKARVQFDGWPAIVFNGWESVSYGTYGAKVVAIENFISDNGMYRVLLAPDTEDHEWPKGIRVGSGAKTIALLNDVPIWYELWRQINGFPPNFYKPQANSNLESKNNKS